MSPKAIFLLVSMIVLLVFSAFFSCCDMVFSCVSLPRLRNHARKGSKAAVLALRFAEGYENTIVCMLFGNSLVNILATSLGTLLAIELFGSESSYGTLIVSACMLLAVLTFGEILPKVIGKVYAFRISLLFAYPLAFFRILFFPIAKACTWFANLVTHRAIEKAVEEEEATSDDELQAMVEDIEKEGIIDEDTSELLSNSIDFSDTSAWEIMTPRVKIEGISVDSDLKKLLSKKGSLRHSRIVVYRKNYDHILGYIPLKEVLRASLSKNDLNLTDYLRSIISVPRTMEISQILRLMKKEHRHIAIVRDEFGGTEGILTMEDILEELVGELWDESEAVREDVTKTEKRNVFDVLGSMEVETFFERFKMDPEDLDEDYNTVSGWINDHLGRFAKEGDHFSYGKIDIKVTKATDFTVEKAEVTYHPRRKIVD